MYKKWLSAARAHVSCHVFNIYFWIRSMIDHSVKTWIGEEPAQKPSPTNIEHSGCRASIFPVPFRVFSRVNGF